jgi:virulence-associated protein VagC
LDETATGTQTIIIYDVAEDEDGGSPESGPTAVDDFYSMDEDTSLILRPLTKGINDSDENDLALHIASINGEVLSEDLTGIETQIIEVNGFIDGAAAVVGEVSIDASGVITFTPTTNYFGEVIFEYVVQNSNPDLDETATGTQTIIIYDVLEDEDGGSPDSGPTAVNDVYSMDEDTSLILRPLTKGINDRDENDLALHIFSINEEELEILAVNETQIIPVLGFIDGVLGVVGNVVIDASGVITFTPVANYNGTVTFDYVVSNSDDEFATGTQTIIIYDVLEDEDGGSPDSGPTAVDDFYSMDEDTSLILRPLFKGINDSDANDLALHIASINSVTLLVQTGTDTQTIPVLGLIEGVEGTVGNVVIDASGVITFTPVANHNGTVIFPYVVQNSNPDLDETATGTQTIIIDDVAEDEDGGSPESGPTAVDDFYSMDEDTSLILRPLTKGINDSDENDLALHIASINSVTLLVQTGTDTQTIPVLGLIDGVEETVGNVVIDASGVITFTPVADYNGTVIFEYVVQNSNPDLDETATGLQTIIIYDVLEDEDGGSPESGPTAVDDFYSMDEDTSLILRPLTKGINDSDANDLALHIESINGELLVVGDQDIAIGTVADVSIVGGVITFTPVADHNGTVIFDYVVSNSDDEFATGTQTIVIDDVAEVDTNPIAVNDFYQTLEDESIIIDPLTRGTNDSDPNGDDLTITHFAGDDITGGVQQITVVDGRLDIDDDGIITFTPDAGYVGSVTFTYDITDGNGGTATGTVDINVIATAIKDEIKVGNTIKNKFTVYPIPSIGNVNVSLKSHISEDVSVILTDITGRVIYSAPVKLREGQNELDFNVRAKPGVLFLRILSSKTNYGVVKIIFK